MISHHLRVLLLAFGAASCGSTQANFSTKFAAGFAPARRTVSVFGVYKDGQMSSEAWDSVAARVSASLGASKCDAGYADSAAASTNPALWAAVDDYARSNGPTDDLLAELAPAAKGDLVLVLTVAGKVPPPDKVSLASEASSPAVGGGRGGGMGTMGGMRGTAPATTHPHSMPAASKDALDLGALLYSVAEKKSVAQISLEYTGASADDAMARFTAKLRESLPAASCAGWGWDAKVDAERIRKLGEP